MSACGAEDETESTWDETWIGCSDVGANTWTHVNRLPASCNPRPFMSGLILQSSNVEVSKGPTLSCPAALK